MLLTDMPTIDHIVVGIIKEYLDSMEAAADERGSRVRSELEARAAQIGPALEEIIEHQQDDWSWVSSVWRNTSQA